MRGSIAVSDRRFLRGDGRSLQIRRAGAARRVAPVATYPDAGGGEETDGRAGSTAWSSNETATTVAQPMTLNHR